MGRKKKVVVFTKTIHKTSFRGGGFYCSKPDETKITYGCRIENGGDTFSGADFASSSGDFPILDEEAEF